MILDVELNARLRDPTIAVRVAACIALARSGQPDAVDILIYALADWSSDVRRVACAGLGELGDRRAMEPLIKRTSDSLKQVRQAACSALGKSGDLRAVEPLIRRLDDTHVIVREAAKNALAGIMEWWQPDLGTLLCSRCLTKFEIRWTRTKAGERMAYLGCSYCSSASFGVDCSRLTAVLDSSWQSDCLLSDETLKVNWLLRQDWLGFDEVEILQAKREEVQKFLGRLKSDPDQLQKCKRIRCIVGPRLKMQDDLLRVVHSFFGRVEQTGFEDTV